MSKAEQVPRPLHQPEHHEGHSSDATARIAERRLRGKPLVQAAVEKLESGLASAERLHPDLGLSAERRAEPGTPMGRAVEPRRLQHPSAYTALAANLWARYEAASVRTLLFLDVECGIRRSGVASDFAAHLAEADAGPVLLIDADLRERPTHLVLAEPAAAEIDLPRVLASDTWTEPASTAGSNLFLLPCGRDASSHGALFQSSAFVAFLRTARESFRAIVIEARHPAAHPETLLLCRRADGVVLVLESEHTRKQSAAWTIEQVEQSGGMVLGAVLDRRRYRIPRWLYRRC